MNLYLTNSGQELLYKAQGGKELNFTRFGLGDGELGGQAIQPLKSLLNEKLPAEIKKLEIKNNKVIIGMSFTNAELVEGFFLRELGLYARNPDTGEEVLYIYGNSGETSDYIDSNTGRVIEEILDVEIYISDVENITATIDGSLVYATQKDIENIRKEIAGMVIPTKTSDLENDSGFLTQETDPTVPSWAKQATKPTYSFEEITGKPTIATQNVVNNFWSGKQAAYDAITSKDSTTLYLIEEE